MSMPTQTPAPGIDAHQHMVGLVFGYLATQAIHAFAELSIADHLADGALTAGGIANWAGTEPDATFRLLRAGMAVGLVTADADKRFASTALLNTELTDR